jgi:hypothetical protein
LSKPRYLGIACGAAAVVVASVWLAAGGGAEPVSFSEPREIEPWPAHPAQAKALRDDALRRARVWRPVAAADVAAFDFGANPPDPSGALSSATVNCRFLSEPVSGTTPKFNCALPDGEVVKVKYGRNPEIQSEAAATRLLTGLGFGADRVYIVPRVRCYGCPPLPFQTSRVLGFAHAAGLPGLLAPDTRAAEYEWVAIERKMEGRPIEVDGEDGWAWYELESAEEGDPETVALREAAGRPAEINAFRLMAAFLGHWDNKAPNQRLLCLAEMGSPDQPCPAPFAIIQDLGASFGPHKVDLQGWRGAAVWADRASCRVSMRHLPFLGATFTDTEISEAGRRLLGSLLGAMSDRQVASLFAGARFGEYENGRWFGPSADENAWVAVFRDKVQQIVEGGPCRSEARPT